MNARITFVIGLAAMSGGCVLPIPTQHVAAPSVHGTIVNAQNQAPVDLAVVAVKEFKAASVMTRRDGSFTTDTVMRSKPYWVWNPLAKPKQGELKLSIVRPGYEKRDKKVKWTVGTQRSVHLAQPIKLRAKGTVEVVTDGLLGNER